jgi:hypothetical protein
LDKNNLAIATITWARDAGEEQVLRQSLESLAALDLPVFITDGGSGTEFLNFLHQFPHFTLAGGQVRGLWPQAKTSLQAAFSAGPAFICYTEPDKGAFFREALPYFLAAAPGQGPTGVLLASRSVTGFASFPAFQRTTETAINHCCAEVVGPAVDYTYGPFLMRRELVAYLDLVPADIGWGWRPYIFGIAPRLGYQVASWQGDFNCPEDQQADSPAERLYRIRQLSQNIQGLLLSTTVSLP